MKALSQIILETRAITEAVFGAKDIVKVGRLIKPVLERRLGKKLYQYGGDGSAVNFKKAKSGDGVGILYFVGENGGALRINWEFKSSKSAGITSADWWNSWSIDKDGNWSKPDYTLRNISDLNSIQLVDILHKFASSPGISSYRISFDHLMDYSGNVLGEDYDEEDSQEYILEELTQRQAKFLELAIKEFGTGEFKKGVLTNFRDKNGFDEKEIRFLFSPKNKSERWGYYKLYPPTVKSDTGEAETTNDIDTKLNNSIKKAEKRDIPLEELFQDLAELTDLVIDNYRPSLLITGSGGTGKSFTVLQRLKAKNLVQGKDYRIKKGGVTTFGLYQELFLSRNGQLLIFDDCDSVFSDITSQNLLKAALDSYDEREIAWTSKATMPIDPSLSGEELEEILQGIEDELLSGEDKVKMPSSFPFEGRVIFISNLPKHKLPQPILSRSLVIDVTLSDGEMVERMRMVINDVASSLGVDNEFAQETMDTLLELSNSGKISQPTMRTLPAAVKIKMSGNPRWSKLLKYTS